MTEDAVEHACVRCGRPGEVRRGAGREVTAGTVAAVLEAGWVVACPEGHHAPPDVGAAVATEVLARVPRATSKRLARGDRCGSCGEPLSMPVRRTERVVTVADVPGVPVTTIRFDVPSTRCLACTTDQVPTRSVDDLRAASEALFAPDAGGV